ncbi:ADP-ribosylglycohydrolase family protein [Williamsia deligens]|uniref:ADP-ribosylglycohydrolase family protein n=1 Tax=Williamsia deligens TaxID=321325 RepID=A0ABW3GCL6_9NOCA|nr:ADP-ribosylglycohydrolase family protein [Williamsia deligens]
MQLSEEQRDRAVGALVGSALGDAVGAGYEFTHPPQDVVVDMIGGGPFDWAPGEWTDDTSMATCVAAGLSPGHVDLDAVAAAFVAWYDTRPADIGNQTRSVLTHRDVTAAAMTARASGVPGLTGGNGSLMRTGPVGVAFVRHDDAQCAAAAGAISDLTHADPRAREACELWSAAIARGIRTGDRSSLREYVAERDAGVREFWEPLLDQAETGGPADFSNNGWVVHALQTAWWAICTAGGDVVGTVENCVRAGGDTDTTAAIAGALAGACAGTAGLPERWTSMLQGYPGWTATDLRATALRLVGEDPVDTLGHS